MQPLIHYLLQLKHVCLLPTFACRRPAARMDAAARRAHSPALRPRLGLPSVDVRSARRPPPRTTQTHRRLSSRRTRALALPVPSARSYGKLIGWPLTLLAAREPQSAQRADRVKDGVILGWILLLGGTGSVTMRAPLTGAGGAGAPLRDSIRLHALHGQTYIITFT